MVNLRRKNKRNLINYQCISTQNRTNEPSTNSTSSRGSGLKYIQLKKMDKTRFVCNESYHDKETDEEKNYIYSYVRYYIFAFIILILFFKVFCLYKD